MVGLPGAEKFENVFPLFDTINVRERPEGRTPHDGIGRAYA